MCYVHYSAIQSTCGKRCAIVNSSCYAFPCMVSCCYRRQTGCSEPCERELVAARCSHAWAKQRQIGWRARCGAGGGQASLRLQHTFLQRWLVEASWRTLRHRVCCSHSTRQPALPAAWIKRFQFCCWELPLSGEVAQPPPHPGPLTMPLRLHPSLPCLSCLGLLKTHLPRARTEPQLDRGR